MASGAGALLDEARLFATTAEAVADCATVYATTARAREMTKRVLTPEAAMAEARAIAAEGGRGWRCCSAPSGRGWPTRTSCWPRQSSRFPVNPGFASLNLAQCVLLTAYEWRRQSEAVPVGTPERATSGDVGRLLDHLTGELDDAGFFWPEHKRAAMMTNLHNLFRRAPLTDQDVRTLWGVIRALAEAPKRRR